MQYNHLLSGFVSRMSAESEGEEGRSATSFPCVSIVSLCLGLLCLLCISLLSLCLPDVLGVIRGWRHVSHRLSLLYFILISYIYFPFHFTYLPQPFCSHFDSSFLYFLFFLFLSDLLFTKIYKIILYGTLSSADPYVLWRAAKWIFLSPFLFYVKILTVFLNLPFPGLPERGYVFKRLFHSPYFIYCPAVFLLFLLR